MKKNTIKVRRIPMAARITLFTLMVLLTTLLLIFIGDNNQAVAEEGAVQNKRFVSIDFNNVDISVFVKFMSELTKKNFVIDQRVRGKVTIISPAKISEDEAYRVFESVLEVHGFALVPSGKVVKIIPSPDARTKSIETRLREEALSPNDRIITQLIPLQYADPTLLKRLLTPMISKSSIILDYAPTNMLIITDVESNIKRLLKIINTIDVTGVGQKISVIPVVYSDATKLVKTLSTVFQSATRAAKGTTGPSLTMVADERTNTIVMRASDEQTQHVEALIQMLDMDTPRGKGNIHVVYLENAAAEDLAKVLQEIPSKDASGAPGKTPSPVVSDKVRITADKATNSLIIMADKEDFQVIENIIKKIDIPRAMVYIEALIMEVNADKNLKLGTEWLVGDDFEYQGKDALAGGGFNSGSPLFGFDPATGGLALPAGMALGVFGETLDIGGIRFPSLSAVANAFQSDSDTNILSTPQISVLDNEEASIIIGETIPFRTKATTTSSSDTFNSFEYKPVGKNLKITPHISKDRMVRLELELNVSAVKPGADDPLTPSTFTREVKTTVIVRDKHTLVIGGLIDDTSNTSTQQVPCLGDVPGFGWLFKNKTNTANRTNLYIFLTPRVIQSPSEARKIFEKKKSDMESIKGGKIDLFKEIDESGDAGQIPSIESFDYSETDQALDATAAPAEPVEPVEAAEPVASDEPVQDEPRSALPAASIYTLQVASYQNLEKAELRKQELVNFGHNAYIVESDINGMVWYRVRVGQFASEEEALALGEEMQEQMISTILIKI
ncbi:MAG: type II secretion system secretin GspD [Desulfobacteraceae bacterium]|nr:type II secretion system secretin GspD [Desulfobacteraceae bacterium]